jgi:hypothetical protein
MLMIPRMHKSTTQTPALTHINATLPQTKTAVETELAISSTEVAAWFKNRGRPAQKQLQPLRQASGSGHAGEAYFCDCDSGDEIVQSLMADDGCPSAGGAAAAVAVAASLQHGSISPPSSLLAMQQPLHHQQQQQLYQQQQQVQQVQQQQYQQQYQQQQPQQQLHQQPQWWGSVSATESVLAAGLGPGSVGSGVWTSNPLGQESVDSHSTTNSLGDLLNDLDEGWLDFLFA